MQDTTATAADVTARLITGGISSDTAQTLITEALRDGGAHHTHAGRLHIVQSTPDGIAYVAYPQLDLDMLAGDIAATFARYDYPIDATESAIRRALPVFLTALATDPGDHDDWLDSGDAATWHPDDETAAPTLQTGPAPDMTEWEWQESHGVQLGSTARDAWYWRCPLCTTWAGPYADAGEAKRTGMDHRHYTHDLPKARRTEARKAARALVGNGFTAAVFAQLITDVALTHSLHEPDVISIVHTVAAAIRCHTLPADLLDQLRDKHFSHGTDRVATVAGDVASRLGRPSWLTSAGA